MGTTEGREPTDTLRGLTATGPSKVGVDKAMRARDVSRPHPDVAEQDDQQPKADGAPRAQRAGGSGSAGSSPDSS
jgi:hypothetical protein